MFALGVLQSTLVRRGRWTLRKQCKRSTIGLTEQRGESLGCVTGLGAVGWSDGQLWSFCFLARYVVVWCSVAWYVDSLSYRGLVSRQYGWVGGT